MLSYLQFKRHPVHESLKRIEDSARSIQADTQNRQSYKRSIRSFVGYVATNIEKTDPEFTPEQILVEINDLVNKSISEIDNFKSNGDDLHLERALANIGAAIRKLPIPIRSRYVSQSNRHIDAFREKGENLIREIRTRAEGVEGKLAEIDQQMDETRDLVQKLEDRAASVIEGLNNSFSESQSNRNTQFAEWQKRQENRIAEQIQKFNEEHTKTNEHANSILNDTENRLSKLDDALKQEIQKLNDTFSTEREKYNRTASESRKEIQSMRDEIRTLYKLTGEDALVGGYQGQANEEAKSANWLRIAAIVLMIISAVVLIYPELSLIDSDTTETFSWSDFLERLPLSTIILVPALYAARESGKHRATERAFRTVQLQIATLDPFISKLQDTKQKQIKEGLVEKYFSGPPVESRAEAGQSELGKIAETLRELMGTLRDLVGRFTSADR